MTLKALARLPRDLHWRFVHIGDGALLADLKAQAKELGLDARIEWKGPQTQDAVIEHYRSADLFVLACRIARDGDRDGLPNVLLEAQCQGLACVSTRISGVPELIEHGRSGVLVPAGDAQALAAALERLIRLPELRERLGAEGARRVRARFSHEAGIDRLAAKFGIGTAAPRRAAEAGR